METDLEQAVTKEEKQEFLYQFIDNDREFCRVFMPDTFEAAYTSLHHKIWDLIDDKKTNKKLFLAPRGLGKTSIAKGVVIKRILFNQAKFVVYISNSSKLAEMQTENIKQKLMTNKTIKDFFGDVKDTITEASGIDGIEEADEPFSKEAWVAYGRTLVLPRGCGQQIRGLNWHDHRPDLIIFDDPEDRKEIRNETNRTENLIWFAGDVSKCVSLYKNDYEMLYLDTLKHEDALPSHIQKMDDWSTIRLQLCDSNYKSLAPDFISDEEIESKVNMHRKAGIMDQFYREYMNIPIAPETASFKTEYFKHYEEGDLGQDTITRMENVVILDPARSTTPQSDFSAIVGVGLDLENRRRYVRDVYNERAYPDDVYSAAIGMCRRLHSRVLGVEVTGLNEFILQPLKDYMMRTGNSDIDIVELKPRRNKNERIAAMIPDYRQGLIYHNRTCCGTLEAQLVSFPSSQYDDLMDALAYHLEILEIGGLYSEPTMDDIKEREKWYMELEADHVPMNYSYYEVA